MKENNFKSYDELPLFLNAKMVAQVLGISMAGTYGRYILGKQANGIVLG